MEGIYLQLTYTYISPPLSVPFRLTSGGHTEPQRARSTSVPIPTLPKCACPATGPGQVQKALCPYKGPKEENLFG